MGGYSSKAIKTKKIGKIQVALTAATLVSILIAASQMQVYAVDYNAEIQKLRNQNTANESSRNNLQNTALSLEARIANLQTTISALESLILSNQNLQNDLTRQIAEHQAAIAREQQTLKESMRQMYVESDMSMIEKMASSKTLSEYVEKEEYSLSAQAAVKKSLDKIAALKTQQEKEKKHVDTLIADSRSMQNQVAAEKSEVDRLLAMNQQEQAAFGQSIATNNSQITNLQRQQAEENARFLREQTALASAARQRSGGAPVAVQSTPSNIRAVSGYNYPWANAPWPNDIPDPWGMYQRQCVSYTAWKVAASGRHMPNWGGRGNANQWDDNARAAGIPVDRNPRVGDVAVRNAGTYGHVMYVEAVHGDGSIRISQYNANWDGRYSEATIFPGDLVFIHF